MAYGDGEEVQVLLKDQGWTVERAGQSLKTFAGKDKLQALARACEWSSKYAEAQGVAAWFLHEGRRTPITLSSRSSPWRRRKEDGRD